MKCPICESEMNFDGQSWQCPTCQTVEQDAVENDDINVDTDDLCKKANAIKQDIINKIQQIDKRIFALQQQREKLIGLSGLGENYFAKSQAKSGVKNQKMNKKTIVKWTMTCLLVALSIVLFALSFTPLISASYDVMNFNVKIDYSAYDSIDLMCATAKTYTESEYLNSTEYEQLLDVMVQLQNAISEDYNTVTSRYVFSDKTNKLFKESVILLSKAQIMSEHTQTGDDRAIIVEGVSSLLYVIASCVLLCLALTLLVLETIKQVLAKDIKAINSIRRAVLAITMVYFVLALLFVWFNVLASTSLSGAMVAIIVLCALAFVAIATVAFVLANDKKALISKLVGCAFVFVIVGCMFAPAFNATLTAGKTYSSKLSVQALNYMDYPEDEETLVDRIGSWGIGDTSLLENKDYLNIRLTKYFADSASGCYDPTNDALSAGYYCVWIVGLLLCASAGLFVAGLYGTNVAKGALAINITVVVLLVATLVCCIASVVLANAVIENYDIADKLSFGIDGGVISTLIVAVLSMVGNLVLKSLFEKGRDDDKEKQTEQEEASQCDCLQTNLDNAPNAEMQQTPNAEMQQA